MQTNAPAGSEFVDQYNRAVTFGQIGAVAQLDRSVFTAEWTSGFRNMSNNTLGLINFNNQTINTDTETYTLETGNSNTAVDGKIKIGKVGTYQITLLYNTYDVSPGSFYSFYIFTNPTSKTAASSHHTTLYDQEPANGSTNTGVRMMFPSLTGTVRVTSAPLWISLVFRPTQGNPFPTDGTSGSTTQYPEVQIVRVA
jgi:hypothetical protein